MFNDAAAEPRQELRLVARVLKAAYWHGVVDQPSLIRGILILYRIGKRCDYVLVLLKEGGDELWARQEDSHEVLSQVGLTHYHLWFHYVAVI